MAARQEPVDRQELDGRNPVAAPPALSADEAKAARLEFLRVMLTELKQMSEGLGERTLSYLVGMAALEAAESAKVHKYRTELHGN